MFQAIIFDFDGVITDSEILHFRAFNQILAAYNIEITKKAYYTDYLGLSDRDLFTNLINNGQLGIDADQVDSLISQKNRIFEKLAKTEGCIIDGVRDFLKILQDNKIAMAICSGALLTEIELILDDSNLRSFFEVIVSAEQVKKGKPDPEGFLLTLQKISQIKQCPLSPNQCIVIEDSHWGIDAANAAGMHTVAITNSYDAERLSCAEKVINNLNELNINDLQQLCS